MTAALCLASRGGVWTQRLISPIRTPTLRRRHRDRVLAAAIRLIDLGLFRPGGEEYAEENAGTADERPPELLAALSEAALH